MNQFKAQLATLLKGIPPKDLKIIGGSAVVLLLVIGWLWTTTSSMKTEIADLLAKFDALPTEDASAESGPRISKNEAAAIHSRIERFKKIRATLESFIPREGGKPNPISINDLVVNIPSTIDVDKSERSDDSVQTYQDGVGPGGTVDPEEAFIKYQSVAYNFVLRSNYASLVTFLKQVDQLHSYFNVRQIAMKALPDDPSQPAQKDPKFLVELTVGTVYMHKEQPKGQ